MTTSRFTLLLFSSTLLLLAFAAIASAQAWLPVPTIIYWIIPGYAALTAFLFRRMMLATKKSASRFVTAFMASVTLKLMATAAFLAIYIYQHKEEKVPVALWTFAIYVVFTVLLVSAFQNEERAK